MITEPIQIGTPRPDESPDDLWRCIVATWDGLIERRHEGATADWIDLNVIPRKRQIKRVKATTTRPEGA